MKPREPTVGLPRYGAIDAYTLEELRREYQNSDAKGRIRLLEKLHEDNWVPSYEIALLAVEDQNVEVRQWIARHGELDYRGKRHVNEQTNEWVYEFPDKNLADRLKKDPDPFVRACVRENEKVYLGKEAFEQANHLERLALVRNPNVSNDLIEKIFNPGDKELGIDLEQRKELVLAYLTNNQNLDRQREKLNDDGPLFYTSRRLSNLWRFISKWPADALRTEVYRVLPNPFEFEERIVWLKDGKVSRLESVLDEGIKDMDDGLRYLAYTKVGYLEPEEIKAILAGNDPYALSGLYHNRSLYVAAKLYKKLVPEGRHWFPLYSGGYARKLGAGNWVSVYDDTTRWNELVKVLYDGVTYNRLGRTKEHLDLVGIFTDLRNHIDYRLEEFYKNNDRHISHVLDSFERRNDLDRASLDKEIEKVPPANPSELFDPDKRPSQGNLLEDKIDYIGTKLLFIEGLIKDLSKTAYKAAIILVVIYTVWSLLSWLFR